MMTAHQETMAMLDVPGAAVAIVQGEKIVCAKGFSVHERGSDEPVTPETLARISATIRRSPLP